MTIVIEDAQMQRLAEQIAAAEGVSVAEVLRESLLSLASARGVNAPQASLRERLRALAQEVDSVPNTPDKRSDEGVLGYNAHGVW